MQSLYSLQSFPSRQCLISSAGGAPGKTRLPADLCAHGQPVPADIISRVPPCEKLVLNFVLSFLEAERLPAQLLVNGGYVRDLLLGKAPDDLDLSLCLRDCAPDVTIDSVLGGMRSDWPSGASAAMLVVASSWPFSKVRPIAQRYRCGDSIPRSTIATRNSSRPRRAV